MCVHLLLLTYRMFRVEVALTTRNARSKTYTNILYFQTQFQQELIFCGLYVSLYHIVRSYYTIYDTMYIRGHFD